MRILFSLLAVGVASVVGCGLAGSSESSGSPTGSGGTSKTSSSSGAGPVGGFGGAPQSVGGSSANGGNGGGGPATGAGGGTTGGAGGNPVSGSGGSSASSSVAMSSSTGEMGCTPACEVCNQCVGTNCVPLAEDPACANCGFMGNDMNCTCAAGKCLEKSGEPCFTDGDCASNNCLGQCKYGGGSCQGNGACNGMGNYCHDLQCQ